MVPTEALSKAIQLIPHCLCWGLWKSFMSKQAPTELLEGLKLSWDIAVPYKKVIAPNLE